MQQGLQHIYIIKRKKQMNTTPAFMNALERHHASANTFGHEHFMAKFCNARLTVAKYWQSRGKTE